MFVLTFALAIISTKLKHIGFNYTIIRILFLLPFYNLGRLYKEKLESIDNLNNKLYFLIILIIQTVLLTFGDIRYNLNILIINKNYLIYFMASLNAIAFWLRISKIFAPFLTKSKIVDYIGNNTFTIMMNHIFSFFILNSIILLFNFINSNTINVSIFNLENGSIRHFQKSVWFIVGSKNVGMNVIYAIFGISFPLLIKYGFQKVRDIIILKNERRSCND